MKADCPSCDTELRFNVKDIEFEREAKVEGPEKQWFFVVCPSCEEAFILTELEPRTMNRVKAIKKRGVEGYKWLI